MAGEVGIAKASTKPFTLVNRFEGKSSKRWCIGMWASIHMYIYIYIYTVFVLICCWCFSTHMSHIYIYMCVYICIFFGYCWGCNLLFRHVCYLHVYYQLHLFNATYLCWHTSCSLLMLYINTLNKKIQLLSYPSLPDGDFDDFFTLPPARLQQMFWKFNNKILSS